VDEGGHLRGAVPAAVVRDEGVGGEHRLELLGRVAAPVAERPQLLEVRGDVPLVPRDEDRLDVREILVERRPPDAGPLRDLRHGHREWAALGGETPSRVQDGVADGAPVLVDRLAPQLRHR
jgi:hypothetical protein